MTAAVESIAYETEGDPSRADAAILLLCELVDMPEMAMKHASDRSLRRTKYALSHDIDPLFTLAVLGNASGKNGSIVRTSDMLMEAAKKAGYTQFDVRKALRDALDVGGPGAYAHDLLLEADEEFQLSEIEPKLAERKGAPFDRLRIELGRVNAMQQAADEARSKFVAAWHRAIGNADD